MDVEQAKTSLRRRLELFRGRADGSGTAAGMARVIHQWAVEANLTREVAEQIDILAISREFIRERK